MELELEVKEEEVKQEEEEEKGEKGDLMGQTKRLVPGSIGVGLFTSERRDER